MPLQILLRVCNLTKNYAKPAGPKRMVSRTCWLTIKCLLIMIHLYSWVVVCNYLLVILQRNDVVNVSAKCLFNTGNLITALAFCLFGFLTPFFSMHSHNQVSYWYCCSVAKLCQTLCNPKDCSTPGLPVLLLEFAQTHIH